MENPNTVFDVFMTPPWDKNKEKVLLEQFRQGILQEASWLDDSKAKWKNGNVLDFNVSDPDYSKDIKMSCKCWLTKDGILHACVNAGFRIDFMPPMLLNHPKECGVKVAWLVDDLFNLEIERREATIAEMNWEH